MKRRRRKDRKEEKGRLRVARKRKGEGRVERSREGRVERSREGRVERRREGDERVERRREGHERVERRREGDERVERSREQNLKRRIRKIIEYKAGGTENKTRVK